MVKTAPPLPEVWVQSLFRDLRSYMLLCAAKKRFLRTMSLKVYRTSECPLCIVLITQLCPTLCDPMDCNLPGCSVHGILQARILEWVALLQGIFMTQWSHLHPWATREAWGLVKIQIAGPHLSISNSASYLVSDLRVCVSSKFSGELLMLLVRQPHSENTEFKKTIYNEKQSYSGEVIID